ncbi:MAG: GNAT family N-acetyltransferase [Chloroflexi bacterium RBG_16_56_11]|nr:MAG: GNAT family N-acetyltransferase [Chloroflexi bacterium RBG_16_56_11]
MDKQTTIATEHLLLRPYTLADAPDLQRHIGERDIAATTINIPHPYVDGMAEEWIGKHRERAEKGEFQFAITDRQDGRLLGGIGFHDVDRESECAEIGYWIAKPYWRNGYGTEAARAILKYGFEVMGLNRIHARHFKHNPASGRIMQKIGMKYEGSLRQHFKKMGNFVDFELYGILKSEYKP